jgi:hypothetical protein
MTMTRKRYEPGDWCPCTKWTKLEGGQAEAEARKLDHRTRTHLKDKLLLEICHMAGEWFLRYSAKVLQ